MSKVVINSFEDLKRLEGEHIGTSEFMVITQECIDTFARATYDNQWIHTDMERAKAESPYHTTIAAAISLEPDYPGEQSAHDGELRH